MVELWIVRHGQTDWNVEGRYQGQADPPLNNTGREQAESLAEALTQMSFDAIYTSDLQRAWQTATIVAHRLNLSVQVDSRLREINQGEWEGRLFKEINNQYAELLLALRQDPYHARPPGGETIAEIADRVESVIRDIADQYPDGKVLIVSHGIALATLLSKDKNLPLSEVHNLIPENANPQVILWKSNHKVNFDPN